VRPQTEPPVENENDLVLSNISVIIMALIVAHFTRFQSDREPDSLAAIGSVRLGNELKTVGRGGGPVPVPQCPIGGDANDDAILLGVVGATEAKRQKTYFNNTVCHCFHSQPGQPGHYTQLLLKCKAIRSCPNVTYELQSSSLSNSY